MSVTGVWASRCMGRWRVFGSVGGCLSGWCMGWLGMVENEAHSSLCTEIKKGFISFASNKHVFEAHLTTHEI